MVKGNTHRKVRATCQPHKSLPAFCPAFDCSSSTRSILRLHVSALSLRCTGLFSFCLQPCYMLQAMAIVWIPECTAQFIPQSPLHWVVSPCIIINQQGFERFSSDSNSAILRNFDLCTGVPSRSLLVCRFSVSNALAVVTRSDTGSYSSYQRFTQVGAHVISSRIIQEAYSRDQQAKSGIAYILQRVWAYIDMKMKDFSTIHVKE